MRAVQAPEVAKLLEQCVGERQRERHGVRAVSRHHAERMRVNGRSFRKPLHGQLTSDDILEHLEKRPRLFLDDRQQNGLRHVATHGKKLGDFRE